ncbi:hypothetical protein BO94DRAFT_478734 [Aspergillus sclerotioniger CBS 115572]|uniref:UbiA prenyltransferase n=1 Tax=Aspergillus sclerotioniger CBS 115572 TaxID=1450535 RepID=A0A317V0Q6_9EURO|nr:hypothetical protein BO94DRAFT_478734 [Aspergillus sclerotioniger CBS 115572]PWY67635.1 hypothetical protein BO94DRAFT_478734 [Aspergillus sclerotioniger CBS 115572]
MFQTLFRELRLCYGFVRRDLGTGLLPVPEFTLASLLYRKAPREEMIPAIAMAFLYGFLYLYTFVVSNQITGVSEDKINKPDRPIASGAESLKAAKIRYWVLTALYLGFGHVLGVSEWALLWILTTIAHNPLGFSNFGPTKDLCMGLGCIAQLKAAWAIGGSPPDMGWEWIKVITLYMLWPIPLQDLRDVPGDLAAGRRTTPILLGDFPARLYISAGIVVSQFLLIKYRILEYRYDTSTIVLSAALVLMTIGCIFRLFAFRSLTSDRFSYWLYTVIYVFQPLSACIALR